MKKRTHKRFGVEAKMKELDAKLRAMQQTLSLYEERTDLRPIALSYGQLAPGETKQIEVGDSFAPFKKLQKRDQNGFIGCQFRLSVDGKSVVPEKEIVLYDENATPLADLTGKRLGLKLVPVMDRVYIEGKNIASEAHDYSIVYIPWEKDLSLSEKIGNAVDASKTYTDSVSEKVEKLSKGYTDSELSIIKKNQIQNLSDKVSDIQKRLGDEIRVKVIPVEKVRLSYKNTENATDYSFEVKTGLDPKEYQVVFVTGTMWLDGDANCYGIADKQLFQRNIGRDRLEEYFNKLTAPMKDSPMMWHMMDIFTPMVYDRWEDKIFITELNDYFGKVKPNTDDEFLRNYLIVVFYVPRKSALWDTTNWWKDGLVDNHREAIRLKREEKAQGNQN